MSHRQQLHTMMKVQFILLCLIILYSTFSDPDTVMASPPKGTIPAYGPWCATGGVFWGKALGNAINIGDAVAVIKGKIHFYISNLNPPDISITKSSFIANVSDISKCETIQDVIGRGCQDYSPIRCKFTQFSGKYILIPLHMTCLSPIQTWRRWLECPRTLWIDNEAQTKGRRLCRVVGRWRSY